MKWSYKTVHFEVKKEGLLGGSFLDETEIEEQLNQFGQSGWELISVIEVQNGIICFFRQALTSISMAYADRLDDAGHGENQYEDRVNDDVLESYQKEEFIEPETLEKTDQSGILDDHPPEPEPEPEIDDYEVCDDYDLGNNVESGSYEDDTYDTVDDVREEVDGTNDEPEDNGIGAIRIE